MTGVRRKAEHTFHPWRSRTILNMRRSNQGSFHDGVDPAFELSDLPRMRKEIVGSGCVLAGQIAYRHSARRMLRVGELVCRAVVDCAELPVRCTQNSIATSTQNSDRCTGGVCGRLGDAHCSAGLDVQEMNWRSECWREVPSIFAGRENLWLAVVNLSHPLVSFASQEDVRNNCGGGISLSVFPVNPVSWK